MNERRVAQKIIQHMHEDHGMNVIPADVMYKIKHSISTINIVATGSPVTKKDMLIAT
jgi:hypothetical protein